MSSEKYVITEKRSIFDCRTMIFGLLARLGITFDGEIYNKGPLREQLKKNHA